MSGSWDVLGIAPTQDRVAIRRAYAAKLRLIDQDNDPAGFMALRNALGAALQAAPEAISASMAEAVMPEPSITPEQLAEKAKIEAFGKAFAEAGQAGRTEDALLAYQGLAAAGALTIAGGIHPAAVQLGLLAARDKTLPLERVNIILRGLGLDAVVLDRLKQHREVAEIIGLINLRSAAENWFEHVERLAKTRIFSRAGWRIRKRIIMARYLLGSWPTRLLVGAAALEIDLKTADPFRIWLEARFARPERLLPERRQQELDAVKRVSRVAKILYFLCFSVLVIVVCIIAGTPGAFAFYLLLAVLSSVRNFGRRPQPRKARAK